MQIFNSWFDFNDNESVTENVLRFLYYLPDKIHTFTNEENSNFFIILKKLDSAYITSENFLTALEEARILLLKNLDTIRSKDNYQPRWNLKLSKVGFTKNSLRLKASILNSLWELVESKVGDAEESIIDFANNSIVKVLRCFLQYLNSILGSLTKVIPGAEAIKEIKEIIESYLGIADELK